MHLTPEQKQIGKDNFDEVVGATRRDFLKKSLAAGVVSGAGLGAMYYGYGAEVKEPVRVGVIGTGDEGSVLIGAITPEFVQMVAIADIRPYNIHRAFHGDHYTDAALAARPGLMAKYGWQTEDEARQHVKVYADQYEQLLDDPNVEGVIIALPLHLHDEAAIKAMRKGKHVLTEKLMAHSVHQCKEMARVAAQTNRLLATGHQRHYNILYDNAVHTIRRGLLGDVHYIRAQWHRGNLPGKDSWKPDLPPPPGTDKKDKEAAKTYALIKQYRSWDRKLKDVTKNGPATEIDVWQKRLAQLSKQIDDAVTAENYGYQEMTLQDGKGTRRTALEELLRWRLWNRTGGGLMAELGSHQLDAAGIFITADSGGDRKVLPLSVQAVGCRYLFPPDREVADHVYCTLEYPGKGYYQGDPGSGIADPNKKIAVTYSSINGN
ncbi:MAG: dehydrogenase, partial [Planctomycetes bacterium RBG_16_64_10]